MGYVLLSRNASTSEIRPCMKLYLHGVIVSYKRMHGMLSFNEAGSDNSKKKKKKNRNETIHTDCFLANITSGLLQIIPSGAL